MVTKKPKTHPFRRKVEGKTDYKKRLHLLLNKKPRIVIRLTNQKIIGQLISFDPKGDKVLVGTDSSNLKKYDWDYSLKNTSASYLTGYLLGKTAVKKGIKEANLDIGFKSPIKKNKTYAFLKGALDGGIEIPHKKEIIPSEERISGKHVEDYAKKIKDQPEYQKLFSKYIKKNKDPSQMITQFQKTKEKIGKQNE